MDHAIINMPFELAMSDEISRRQFHARAQGILNERDQFRAEVERLQIETQRWKNQHERDSKELRRLCAERDQYRMRLRNALAHGSANIPGESHD